MPKKHWGEMYKLILFISFTCYNYFISYMLPARKNSIINKFFSCQTQAYKGACL